MTRKLTNYENQRILNLMNHQKPCEYNYPQCQKIATISHYLANSNFTKSCWTCVNCWKVICKREIE